MQTTLHNKVYIMRFLTCLVVLLTFALVFSSSCAREQSATVDSNRRKSPIAIAKIKYGGTYVKIVYGQPYKKGRDIFGSLVPFDVVWRTGANEATELTTTQPILVGEEMLDAGTYALFTIPHRDTWTIILNSELGQWGAFEYNSEMDVFRINVPVSEPEHVSEAFTIQFGDVYDDSSSIILRWDKTDVQIPITFLPSSDSRT